jgi:NADPH2:quinone reductase
MQMQAVRVAEYGASNALKCVSFNSKPTIQRNELLIRNHAIGVNFIDTYQRTGLYPLQLPFTLGRHLEFNLGKVLEW